MVKTDYILKNRQGNLLFRVRFVNILNIYTRPKKGMNVAISKVRRWRYYHTGISILKRIIRLQESLKELNPGV
jgi:hypothetical protein